MQVIAFISGKGGVGKSTLTANVGIGLVQRRKKVLLIDLDPQNVQRLHMGLDPQEYAGLAREGITPGSVFDSPFGASFIPFGRLQESELEEFEAYLEAHPSWLLDRIRSLASAGYDYILLDTPPGPTVYLQQALHAANRALVVVLADVASFATIPRIQSLVQEYTARSSNFLGMDILINQMPTHGKLGHQVRLALYANYATQIVPVAVHKDHGVAQALAFERPVLQYEPNCPASQDIQSVADWLIDSGDQ
jgi:cellulose synthase operon protein YhjQ